MRLPHLLTAFALLCVAAAGCNCGDPCLDEDPAPECGGSGAGGGGGQPDGGKGPADGGARVDSGITDGGRAWFEFNFPNNTAHEPCTEATIALAKDGGLPQDLDVYLPLCIAVRQVSGNAQLNGAPVTASIHWAWSSSGYGSEFQGTPASNGDYKVNVLRASYQASTWHPSSIFPTHQGPIPLGSLNLLDHAVRNVATRSWQLSGKLTFGGLPWLASANPPDVQLLAVSQSYQQGATTSNLSGNYTVRLVEGSYQVLANVPREALGTTELSEYPLELISLNADATMTRDIPVSQLTGTVTLDGQPVPARAASGPDWFMEYEQSGAIVARTHHEGDEATVRALLPKGFYAVNLGFPTGSDRTLPAYLYHRRLSSSLDLSNDAVVNYNLNTKRWEGALLVDGQPVPQNVGGFWTLYAYAYDQGAANPWFVSYYDVPFDSSAFSLRFFPATYYTQVYIDDRFAPDLMAGWYTHNRQLTIQDNISSVINIDTAELTGTLTIDGQPASAGLNVGQLILAGSAGTFRKKLDTTDGTFKVRVPKGTYDISFIINGDAYPEYATGRRPLADAVEITTRTSVTLKYDTVRVAGPLAVSNALVPNTSLALPELGLRMFPAGAAGTWTKKLEGGRSWYSFRMPEGDWDIDVRIEEGALPETAFGVAPYADAYPMRPPR